LLAKTTTRRGEGINRNALPQAEGFAKFDKRDTVDAKNEPENAWGVGV
jgi:hypothetical protein